MDRIQTFSISGKKFAAFTDQKRIFTNFSEGNFLEKVFVRPVAATNMMYAGRVRSMSVKRMKNYKETRHNKKTDPDKHQWDISRRDHGSVKKLQADYVGQAENFFIEPDGKMAEAIFQYHTLRSSMAVSQNLEFSEKKQEFLTKKAA